jgi:hypothetical protein
MSRYRKISRTKGEKRGRNRVHQPRVRQVSRRQEARTRGLAAINGVRKGKYKSLSVAARTEGTTVESIKRLLPGALLRSRPGKRLRVRASDRYTQLVEVLDSSGEVAQVIARGSRERELAGKHRATCFGVLEEKLPASAPKAFSRQEGWWSEVAN